MDTHRYEEWLALWTPDARYWVPCNSDDIDPAREVSIIYDDHERLQQRVQRLKSGTVLAQDPAPRMRRIVSNIEIETVDARAPARGLELPAGGRARARAAALGGPHHPRSASRRRRAPDAPQEGAC